MAMVHYHWLFALLFLLVCGPTAIADSGLSTDGAAKRLSPSTAAKLCRLLPFPEASLDPKIELSMGLGYSPDQGFRISRESSDYAAKIVIVRRQLTGSTADAYRYRVLGNLYREAGLALKSQAAFERSKALDLGVLRKHPADSAALADYGRDLVASGQTSVAEAFLRRATKIAPKSAEVWLALGSVLDDESSPKTEARTHWEHDVAKAYDKAVSLAPQNPTVWAMRGGFRTYSLPQFQGKVCSRDGLSDYERAAALSPDNPYAQAMVSWIDCVTFELALHMFTSLKAAKMEPPASDHRADSILRRITVIAKSTQGQQSASAYAARAWVQFEFFHDSNGAQKSLSLALRQNPRQQDAIDYQMHVAAVVGDYPLLAAACRRELRVHPTLRLGLLLAEADYYLGQQEPLYWQEARTQLEIAHVAEPKDYAINLGLAVLLLKSEPLAPPSRVALLLDRIAAQVPIRPKEQQAEYDLTRGLCFALAGNAETSRRFFRLTLQNAPENRAATSALALLDIQNI